MEDLLCPCQSDAFYADCCQPYIEGRLDPPTAEALMRSRYSAYFNKQIGYIQDTMSGPSLMHFNPIETMAWLEQVEWQALHIMNTEKGLETDTEGIVEFQAFYSQNKESLHILERSEFRKINGKWFYVNGEHF